MILILLHNKTAFSKNFKPLNSQQLGPKILIQECMHKSWKRSGTVCFTITLTNHS